MTDHWNFVFAAYGLAALVLGGYWRRLVRLERDLNSRRSEPHASPSGHPRSKPASRTPVP